MHEKRYQVFISSTFEDLRAERRAVQDIIISTGDFPIQMENFPAADEDQFEFIKSLIDQCDYYFLIIAGRYGSVAPDGLSYTHKEFRYAIQKDVPVLVMVHSDPGSLRADQTERTPEAQDLLQKFIEEAETGRLRRSWKTADELKLCVREALDHAKATKPRTGWVRGNSVASADTLEELNNVRKEIEQYRATFGHPEVGLSLPKLPETHEILNIDLIPGMVTNSLGTRRGSPARIKTTWIRAFSSFFFGLKFSRGDWDGDFFFSIDERESCIKIGSALAGELMNEDTDGLFEITLVTFEKLRSYYSESGLMNAEGPNPFTPLAEKVARRYQISGQSNGDIGLASGELKISRVSRSDFDDEIPF